MKWVITGGCGFIGKSLVGSLTRERGHCVRVVDNLSVGTCEDLAEVCSLHECPADKIRPMEDFSANSVELVAGDILDNDLILKASAGAEIIVHLAANTGVPKSVENPREDCVTNILGTLNCLEAARHAGVKRFIFASSGAPIGASKPPIHEEMAPHPVSPYGASKLACEGYCSAYFRTFGVETVALRFGNVYGPGSGRKNSVVAKFIREAVNGETLEIYGDGTQTRDYIYLDDLLSAIRLAAIRPGIGGEIFQIATSSETSVSQLARKLVRALAAAGIHNTQVRHRSERLGDVPRNFSDTTKAQNVLNWKAKVALEEGLERTVRWFVDSKR